ncbi:hypothetical protein GCM10007966_05010 [Legionella impletisoli]|uniref:Uncharacterized protein n=1 Tax=Legionella impletisoli TaxID=343510 RepID=A0A917JR25_9GAMM|nr:hypothetical protein GCM10007966_05010 [Legionella impletisoli]
MKYLIMIILSLASMSLMAVEVVTLNNEAENGCSQAQTNNCVTSCCVVDSPMSELTDCTELCKNPKVCAVMPLTCEPPSP